MSDERKHGCVEMKEGRIEMVLIIMEKRKRSTDEWTHTEGRKLIFFSSKKGEINDISLLFLKSKWLKRGWSFIGNVWFNHVLNLQCI